MLEANSDFIGWISIDGTKLNYPVMFTPRIQSIIFTEILIKCMNTAGFRLWMPMHLNPASTNVIIYGHNMKNDTMFSVSLNIRTRNGMNSTRGLHLIRFMVMPHMRLRRLFSRHSTKVRRASAIMAWWMRLIRRNLMTIWRISGVCSFMIQGWRSAMATV